MPNDHQPEPEREHRGERTRRAYPAYPSYPDYSCGGGDYPAGGESFNLMAYVQVIRERFWVIVTLFVAILAGAVLYTAKRTPLYRATSRLQSEREIAKVLDVQDMLEPQTTSRYVDPLNTYVESLKSLEQARAVLETIRTEHLPRIARPASVYLATLSDRALARSVLKATRLKDSQIIEIQAATPYPEVSQLLANVYPEVFIQRTLEDRVRMGQRTVETLQRQAEAEAANVKKAEEAVESLLREHGVVSLEQSRLAIQDRLSELETVLNDARRRAERYEALAARLAAIGSGVEAFSPSSQEGYALVMELQEVGSVKQLQADLVTKEAERAALGEKYLPEHPKMIEAQAAVTAVEARLAAEVKASVKWVNAKVQEARGEETRAQAAIAEERTAGARLEELALEHSALTRNLEMNRKLHESMLEKIKETGVSTGLQTNDLRVSEQAELPGKPFYPDWRRVLLLAVLGAGFVSVFVVIMLHRLDDRIKGQEDMEQVLGIPMLGFVPRLHGGGGNSKSSRNGSLPLVEEGSESECFRTIRAGLAFAEGRAEAPVKTVAVVSSQQGEGKTLIACNLALVFGHQGNRTLLIDGDLRRPAIHRTFGLEKAPGLADVLEGKLEPESVVKASGHSHVDLITAGKSTRNASDLLVSPRMGSLLAWARERYDRVIVDTPPIAVVSDSLVVAQSGAGALLVTRFNSVKKGLAVRALRRLDDAGTTVLGGVINDIDTHNRHYYYYYYPYYHDKYYHHESDRSAARSD